MPTRDTTCTTADTRARFMEYLTWLCRSRADCVTSHHACQSLFLPARGQANSSWASRVKADQRAETSRSWLRCSRRGRKPKGRLHRRVSPLVYPHSDRGPSNAIQDPANGDRSKHADLFRIPRATVPSKSRAVHPPCGFNSLLRHQQSNNLRGLIRQRFLRGSAGSSQCCPPPNLRSERASLPSAGTTLGVHNRTAARVPICHP
jgi:hypothetical protein